ncbi:MAG: Single-stranded-DNA-specific exonuclease RecJ [Parcubacteria group bacterium GW2011_GWA2_43_9b]|nr:MAG: Single-stranded-DNA-specific exonuclease RecJ [Parcubacteria group bacterium GW2011_GWA2_43_9b]
MLWKLKPTAPKEFIAQFPEYPPAALELLWHRGLDSQEKIDEFFNPDYEDLHDPFLMLGMKEAIKRLEKAIKKKTKIAIFGDYDADGVCGAVILKTVLEKLGADVSGRIYVPDRVKEGYGLNQDAIKKMAQEKVKLLVTVDCGISETADVDFANSSGIEVIITDHHQPGKKLPKAKAIINPWQAKDKYPFKELAGVGVAFKLAQALLSDKCSVISDKSIPKGWEKWLLDLVALGTVADCVPLLGENRILVKYGLIVLAQTQRAGLQELMKVARLNPIYEIEKLKTNLDTYSLGFVLAPRLNAAGRIDHADLAVDLLLTEDRAAAQEMAQKINDHNRQRQKITEDIVMEIERRIKDEIIDDENNPVIIASDPSWSPGVIGLVAGKIADRYNRPTFIFSAANGNGSSRLRGSARSVPDFNLIEAISQCADLLIEFGGHIGAAGLELPAENLEAFKIKINAIAREAFKGKDLTPVLEADLKLQAKDIDWDLFDNLEKLEPFGEGNARPLWLVENLTIVSARVVGNGSKHLKLELKNENLPNKKFKAIGFGLAKNGNANLSFGDKIDIVCELIVDEWNGTRNLQLKIIDIKSQAC